MDILRFHFIYLSGSWHFINTDKKNLKTLYIGIVSKYQRFEYLIDEQNFKSKKVKTKTVERQNAQAKSEDNDLISIFRVYILFFSIGQ